jgi:hypothetical protein
MVKPHETKQNFEISSWFFKIVETQNLVNIVYIIYTVDLRKQTMLLELFIYLVLEN